MEFKTAEHNPRAEPRAADRSRDQSGEIDLYDDLLAFSDLSPEEQEAALLALAAPAEAGEPNAASEAQTIEATKEHSLPPAIEPALKTYDAFLFEPPPRASIEDAAFDMAEERIVETVAEKAPEPEREPDSDSAQARAFDNDRGANFQLAEILRVTGPLPGLSKKRDTASVMSVCAECGSPGDGEEMFCIACGGLLEEAAAPPAFLTCDDCGSMVASDEIICPSCGSVMSGL